MTRNFFNRYLDTALQLVNDYNGTEPLSHYLKNYFAQHKKHGSKDRKWIAHFCYCYYRSGFALQDVNKKERLLATVFLCTGKTGDWLSMYDEAWQQAYTENFDERIRFVQSVYTFHITDIFYSNGDLSQGINTINFNASHLIQPNVFLRLRPGKETIVKNKLEQNGILFAELNRNCLALESTTKTDSIIDINREAVIQDASSQQVASFFPPVSSSEPLNIWDCCAASGGKSILAYDSFSRIQLTVSDIRESILRNLRERFREAGIQHYKAFTADVSSAQFSPQQQYDLVICDVPCSGSGTWSRTPEQLCFFTEEKLAYYAQLQQKITASAIQAVKPNGYLLYITCSVFQQENEERISYIKDNGHFTLIKANVIAGYDKKADTMFAALFIRRDDSK